MLLSFLFFSFLVFLYPINGIFVLGWRFVRVVTPFIDEPDNVDNTMQADVLIKHLGERDKGLTCMFSN